MINTTTTAEAMQAVSCHYCGRTGQQLAPCCDREEHQHQMACADVAACRDYLLGELREHRATLEIIAVNDPDALHTAIVELHGDDEDQADDHPEPYCQACGAAAGIFIGHGDAWLHYTGEGTAASPVELFDAGHEPVIAWRPVGRGLIGRLVEDACDDSPCPTVGLVVGQVDEDTLEVLWGDRRFEDNPGPGVYEPFDALRPARDGAR